MSLITRQGKGSKLTIQEMDGNLEYLQSLTQNDQVTLVSDADSYIQDGDEIYPGEEYYGTTEYDGKYYHIMNFRKKSEDFPINESGEDGTGWYIGLFEEDGSQLVFKNAVNLEDFFSPSDIVAAQRIQGYTSPTTGTGYSADTEYDLINGSGSRAKIKVTDVDENGAITGLIFVDYGVNYSVDDVLTVDGGDGEATITVDVLSGIPLFSHLQRRWQKANGGIEFMVNDDYNFIDNDGYNTYARMFFTVAEINGEVQLTGTLESSRTISSNPKTRRTIWGENHPSEWQPMYRSSDSSFGAIHKYINLPFNESTGIMGFAIYDFITDVLDVKIEDLQEWWDENSGGIPWEQTDFDGNPTTPNFKGFLINHPDRPMLLAQYYYGGNVSGIGRNYKTYLVELNPNRVTDLGIVTTDFFRIEFTENKIYLIERYSEL